ncbi:GNAT family N-acetyltransferase [Brevibacterium sp. 50QC2O2]|uniref:GNAT family N-acetyltransferase n=1 Tax=Brevibacterium sp. 50QC2O2 TaxID=2968459 RepID=UPI00211CA116|nr:GNAT family protein [Brevibacterium sp. 50QC2O2]MCQ9387460.1 GNAT family N-acetyltransferase [Brevibacterium sp. 50QC2O2]
MDTDPQTRVDTVQAAEPVARPNDPSLRPLRTEDATDVAAAFVSNPDMARQGEVTNAEEALLYIERLVDPARAHHPWAIVDQHGVLGLVCVDVDALNRNGWFWYWMTDRSRGRGWAKRAAATVADWALQELGLERLELGHRVNNPASGAVARAAGFVYEGTERGKFLIDGHRIDVLTYGRLQTDPTPCYSPLRFIE